MNIGVAYENGRIAKNLGDCREVLIITTEGREPVGKRIAGIAGTSATDLIKFAGLEQIDMLHGVCRTTCSSAVRSVWQRATHSRCSACCSCPAVKARRRNRLQSSSSVKSRVTRPSSRSAVRKIRMIRWHACTTVQSAPAAARASCSSRFRSRRSSKKYKNHRFSVVFMFPMEN